jgi:hypothetical protein
MKDKNTIKAEKLAEQEAQRKALGDLLEELDLHKGRFSELLGIKSRGTVYTWLAAPNDGGVPIPGPVWRWIELLADQPHMLGWLERRLPKGTATPADKRNRARRDSYGRRKEETKANADATASEEKEIEK